MRGWGRALGYGALLAMLAALYMVFIYAPTEATMGHVQRIFYFHVPSAWVSFLAFFLVFLTSIFYLRRRTLRWDIISLSSAEIGLLFCSLALVTGSIWAKPAWGTWWTWEPRLTTTLVLWLIYAAYLMLRGTVSQRERAANLAAVVGIVGFLDVPIVFMAIRWWRTIHPVVFQSGEMALAPSMLFTLLVSLAAFTLLYLFLLLLRIRMERTAQTLEGLRREWEERRLTEES